MAVYYGITIGPVYNTLTLTSKPAGLWGGSYLFSYLARELCEALVENGVRIENIVSPYFVMDEKNEHHIRKEISGVGLFHDRIIFQADDKNMADICRVTDAVKSNISRQLAEATGKADVKAFMENYFQISIVSHEVAENENPIEKLSPFLDGCELMPTFNQNIISNPIIDLVDKDNDSPLSGADKLKRSFLVKDCDDQWPLYETDGKSIKSMKSIAERFRENSDLKIYRYCAIVQADGDGMGKVLKGLYTNLDIKRFSKCCFDYAIKASKTLDIYGAVTIYAGGDDLLFIAPLIGANGHLFDLLEALKRDFNSAFSSMGEIQPDGVAHYKNERKVLPTISFGVSVHYYKFPLYESFQNAADALFAKAKKMPGKNAVFMEITKHSGTQFSIGFQQTDTSLIYKTVVDFLKSVWDSAKPAEVVLNSVLQKLRMFDALFFKAFEEGDTKIQSFIDNTFDNDYHNQPEVLKYLSKIKDVLCALRKYYSELQDDDKAKMQKLMSLSKTDDGNDMDQVFIWNCIDSIFRLLKFFVERGDE